MDYGQAVAYLYDRLPVFHRVGAKALKPGLGNTEVLCAGLGNPERRFRSIHVAGTNGKGSTSHLLASVYQAAGYRVGLYTSPHLKSFTERIRINGEPMPDDDVAAFVTQHQALIESIEPSFFEVTVALAFDYFARKSVDLAIIEVGLGGRLDSTNVITPLLSVITNIGFDHTDILGNTLAEIAAEKAGIIKPGVPVILGETQPEIQAVFMGKAADCQTTIIMADQIYTVVDEGLKWGRREVIVQQKIDLAFVETDYALDLLGAYQLKNLPAVLASVEALQAIFFVPGHALAQGLSSVMPSTGLKGRFQYVQEQPRVVADTAHNVPGIRALLDTIATLSYGELHLIIGFVADKDVSAILELLPTHASYYFCQSGTPRSLSAVALAELAQDAGLVAKWTPDQVYEEVNQAVVDALDRAMMNDLVIITGSTYLVAELADL